MIKIKAIIKPFEVARILKKLVGREVTVTEGGDFEILPQSRAGLVDDDDRLVGLIAADQPFVHMTGAALAAVPGGVVADHGDELNEEWLEFYREIANVLSRAVNEAMARRIRLDPGMDHDDAALDAVKASGVLTSFAVSIDGYGDGNVILGAST